MFWDAWLNKEAITGFFASYELARA